MHIAPYTEMYELRTHWSFVLEEDVRIGNRYVALSLTERVNSELFYINILLIVQVIPINNHKIFPVPLDNKT